MATKRDRKTAFPFIKPKGSIKKDVQQYRWVDVSLFVYRLDETISFGRIFHFSSLDFELINVVSNCLKQRAIESVGGRVRESESERMCVYVYDNNNRSLPSKHHSVSLNLWSQKRLKKREARGKKYKKPKTFFSLSLLKCVHVHVCTGHLYSHNTHTHTRTHWDGGVNQNGCRIWIFFLVFYRHFILFPSSLLIWKTKYYLVEKKTKKKKMKMKPRVQSGRSIVGSKSIVSTRR